MVGMDSGASSIQDKYPSTELDTKNTNPSFLQFCHFLTAASFLLLFILAYILCYTPAHLDLTGVEHSQPQRKPCSLFSKLVIFALFICKTNNNNNNTKNIKTPNLN